MTENLVHRIAFASIKGMNPTLGSELLARIGSERAFFDASAGSLAAVMGFNNRIFADSYRAGLLEKAKREADFVTANNITPLYFTDAAFPQRLVDINDAPAMLYTLGSADLNKGMMMAIVGTRHATPYGIDFINRLVDEISQTVAGGVTIISGLAFGADAAAHSAALRNDMPTAGVLAHGLNMIYPSRHRSLASDMVRHGGLLVTEYRSDAAVHKGNFIARNRIVAALCDALVVAESARKGGALISARLASGYNRDVFALPGRTSDLYSQGCNHLIATHTAALVETASDLIDAMRWPRKSLSPSQPSLFPELSAEEQTVVDCLTLNGEAHLTQLTMLLNMPVSKVMALLIDMEFKNLLITYPGGKYRLASR
ncbi:MAG: DNA-processing protein DprA [Firmicutes bacterium]|nr:DNA-processing protein DprA [Bacillota bacterium]MCM1400765.1 DNA-processing protein DprA [Bacteroides sp.]MCM1477612.1 DNA-processing protein DprA [Bacteroides sp.]